MSELYFRFRFSIVLVLGITICIGLPNFIQTGPFVNRDAVIAIFKMVAVSHVGFAFVNGRPPAMIWLDLQILT